MLFLAAGISKLLDPLRDFQLAGAKMSRCQVGRSASIGIYIFSCRSAISGEPGFSDVFSSCVLDELKKVHQLTKPSEICSCIDHTSFFMKQMHTFIVRSSRSRSPKTTSCGLPAKRVVVAAS